MTHPVRTKPPMVPEFHQSGVIEISPTTIKLGEICDLGLQIAPDGRIWLCINGQAFVRFKPFALRSDAGLK